LASAAPAQRAVVASVAHSEHNGRVGNRSDPVTVAKVVGFVVWALCYAPGYLLWQRWNEGMTFPQYMIVFFGPVLIGWAAERLVQRSIRTHERSTRARSGA
jgi:hypothetical protein